jgi:hypothetical protein
MGKFYIDYNLTKMKVIVFSIVIILTSVTCIAQTGSEPRVQNISTDSAVVYRLFATKNMYTFIKLNTRNGQMWQVQWGMESKFQFQEVLSDISRVSNEEERNGRFFLYPTTNTYNFILLDQIDGRVWQVQWSTEANKKIVDRLY